jgi:ubiquinone/menaquinone biosynthesis C-methylase UbiE
MGYNKSVKGGGRMSEAAYDAIAEWYDSLVRGGGLIEMILPNVYALIGDARGQHICDLACGQGVVARELSRQGANVVGVDISRKLLQIAQRYEENESPIAYVQGDAQVLACKNAAFDGVVCNMALMDISDLSAVFSTVARILKPDGWFVFSITHPCLETIKGDSRWMSDEAGSRSVTSYFVEGRWRSSNPDGVRGKVSVHHRTLSTYVNTLGQVGLTLERLVEPQAVGELAERIPMSQDIPISMIVRCRKADNQ